jgi:hypothetical protein
VIAIVVKMKSKSIKQIQFVTFFQNLSMFSIEFVAGAVGVGAPSLRLRLRLRLHQNDADPCGSGSATLIPALIVILATSVPLLT